MSPSAGYVLRDQIAPRIAAAVPRTILPVGSEDAEELVADGIAMAANMVNRLEQQNKFSNITPGNVAFYFLQHMKSGRRSFGASTVDALGIGAQLNGRSRTTSFNEPVQIDELGEEFTVNDVLSLDDEDPGQKAARKMDWEAFLAGRTVREKSVVEGLFAGRSGSEIARICGLDPSTIRYFKNRLSDKVLAFMGHDILAEIRRWPSWKNNLNANRERLACKNERRN
jgi:DNA-directed RNA polymerase specialized sigma24 family protein